MIDLLSEVDYRYNAHDHGHYQHRPERELCPETHENCIAPGIMCQARSAVPSQRWHATPDRDALGPPPPGYKSDRWSPSIFPMRSNAAHLQLSKAVPHALRNSEPGWGE